MKRWIDTLLVLLVVSCGNGGVVDNGYKPPKDKMTRDGRQPNDIKDLVPTRVFEKFQIGMPQKFTLNKSTQTNTMVRFSNGDLIVQLSLLTRPCGSATVTNPHGVAIVFCQEKSFDAIFNPTVVVRVAHNLPPEWTEALSDTLQEVSR